MILSQLKSDYKRIFSSPKIYLSVLGVALLCYISTQKYIHGGEDIYYILDLLIGLSVFKKLIVIFAAVPCVTGFYDDWKHQYIKNLVVRTGKKNYMLSKIIVCVTISFLVVFIGILLFLCGLIITGTDYSGIYRSGALNEVMPYGVLLYQNSFWYVCTIVSIYALSMSVWVMSGLMISAYIPNSFVAVCSPLIFSYLLEEITAFFPTYLNMYLLTKGSNILGKNAVCSYIYTIFVFLLMVFGEGYVFRRRVKRRLENEIS